MRTKLANCPKCDDDQLKLWRGGNAFSVRCEECGWFSGVIMLGTGEDLATVAAATVAKAKSIATAEQS